MALTNKQHKYLRSLAQTIDIHYQIGKFGINDSCLVMLNKALVAHELIKISLLKSIDDDKETIASQLADRLQAQVVQIIGKQIILYRLNQRDNRIKLPK